MISKAAASSIAASGGIRPDSHITARPVTAIKAGSAALTLVAATLSIVLGGTTVAIAGVIEGRLETSGRSDLSPSSTFCQPVPNTPMIVGAPCLGIGRAAKNMASEPDACAGVGSPRQGTLTITGSNVRLGTEMPVALSSF